MPVDGLVNYALKHLTRRVSSPCKMPRSNNFQKAIFWQTWQTGRNLKIWPVKRKAEAVICRNQQEFVTWKNSREISVSSKEAPVIVLDDCADGLYCLHVWVWTARVHEMKWRRLTRISIRCCEINANLQQHNAYIIHTCARAHTLGFCFNSQLFLYWTRRLQDNRIFSWQWYAS